VLGGEQIGDDRPGRDDKVTAAIGGDVETTTDSSRPTRTIGSSGMLVHDRNDWWPVMVPYGAGELPGVETVDHHDIRGR
jgi:hypothetical protein